jgi:hypothetical protein
MIKTEISFKGIPQFDQMAKQFPAIAAKALNSVARDVKPMAIAAIRERYAVKSSDLSGFLKVRNASIGRLAAFLVGRSRMLSMQRFNPKVKYTTKQGRVGKARSFRTGKGRQSGVQVMIRQGAVKNVKGGFAVPLSSGVHVAVRTGKFTQATKGNYAGRRREQIEILRVISPSDMLGSRGVQAIVNEHVTRLLPIAMDAQLKAAGVLK